MKRTIRGGLVIGALLVSATAALAAVANGVSNGNFQTNTLAGWTSTCAASSSPVTGSLGASDLAIDSGSIWAYLNSQGQVAATCEFYQDVAIPAGASAASLTMRYALTGSNAGDPADSRRIDVTTTAGVVLVPIQAPVTRATTRSFAPLAAPVNLSAYAGQTVRIRAQITHTSGSGSANVIGLDDVVLNITTPDTVPTMSEWAMILFGGLLAGGAAVMIQRRRVSA